VLKATTAADRQAVTLNCLRDMTFIPLPMTNIH